MLVLRDIDSFSRSVGMMSLIGQRESEVGSVEVSNLFTREEEMQLERSFF